MGANTYTTTDLLNNILLVAHVPTGNNTFTSENVINLADRELQTAIVSQLQSVRGGFFLTYADYANTADGLYLLPSDCVANSLEGVQIVSGTGVIPISIIEEAEQFSTEAPSSSGYGCFLKGNYVQILPFPTSGNVRLWYLRRPSKLVPVSSSAQITAVAANVITVSSLPATFLVDVSVDAIADQPPFNVLSTRTITDINGTDITLDDDVTDLAVGDWIALENQSPIPQIPVEFRPLLEQRVVVKIYELQGYLDKMKVAKIELNEIQAGLMKLISPRVKSSAKVISSSNGGFLGGRGRGVRFTGSA